MNNRINHQIRATQVRLVDLPEGHTDGIFSLQEALNLAKTLELDLIEVSNQSSPPVCKIMDFSKFKFDQAKKEREKKYLTINFLVGLMKSRNVFCGFFIWLT